MHVQVVLVGAGQPNVNLAILLGRNSLNQTDPVCSVFRSHGLLSDDGVGHVRASAC